MHWELGVLGLCAQGDEAGGFSKCCQLVYAQNLTYLPTAKKV